MIWIARYRIVLWLTALAIGPALLLDLLAVGPAAAPSWTIPMGFALWFGAPYYLAQTLIGAVAPDTSLPAYAVGAAVIVGLLGVALDQGVQRKVRRLGVRLPEA